MIETNAESVADWIEDEADSLENDVEDMLDTATENTLDRARQEVPVRTGALRASLDSEGHTVFSNKEYAPHVGLGTIHMEQRDYLWGPAREELQKALREVIDE